MIIRGAIILGGIVQEAIILGDQLSWETIVRGGQLFWGELSWRAIVRGAIVQFPFQTNMLCRNCDFLANASTNGTLIKSF